MPTSISDVLHTNAKGGKVSDLTMRVYFPQELDALLACAGFVIDAKYGDYDLSAFGPASQKQLIVAHPA